MAILGLSQVGAQEIREPEHGSLGPWTFQSKRNDSQCLPSHEPAGGELLPGVPLYVMTRNDLANPPIPSDLNKASLKKRRGDGLRPGPGTWGLLWHMGANLDSEGHNARACLCTCSPGNYPYHVLHIPPTGAWRPPELNCPSTANTTPGPNQSRPTAHLGGHDHRRVTRVTTSRPWVHLGSA